MKLRRLAPLGVAALLLSTTAACGSDSHEVGSVPTTTAVELEPGPSEGLHLEAAVDRLETKEYQTVLFAASVEQANREEFLIAAKAEMDRQEAEAEAARARAAEAERQRQATAARPQRRQSERSASPAPQRQHRAAPAPSGGSGRCGGALPPCYVMHRESGGDITAHNPTSSAAGKWQFLDSTWNGYGGYSSADAAPESVQDAKARELWAGGGGCSHWSAC